MSKLTLSGLALVTAAAGLAVASVTALASGAAAAPRLAAMPHAGRAALRPPGARMPLASAARRPLPTSGFTDWPMFRADPTHSGVSPETAISTTTAPSITAGWTATLGTTSYASPAVATSASLGKALVYAAANGRIYAYPAAGGAPVWTRSLGTGGGAIETSPAVFGGVVYIGSTAGTIYAFNASTGARLCSFPTGQLIQASPVVVSAPDGSGPVIYDGTAPPSGLGAEWAIYGPGNTHGSCTKDWEFTSWPVSPDNSWSSPAYGTDANGVPVLVFGSRDPDDSVYALNASTGALAWRYQTSTRTEFDVGAPPTISPPGQNGFADGVVYVTGKDHDVYALDLTTGVLIWRYRLQVGTNGDVSGTALAGNQLYLGSDTGVYALNASTGALAWHVLSTFTFYASPAVTGPAGQQVLLIGNNEGRLYALNLATGATVWTRRPITKGFWASPAVSQGAFYVAGLDGVLRSYAPR